MKIISIIIVNWKTKNFLRKCLQSIKVNSTNELNYEIIVVDNNSKDGTVEMIRKEFPLVKLIANSKNVSYAAGNNQGWRKSSGEYILFLNPDTELHKNSLEKLLNFMNQNPKAGACTGRLKNLDNTDQKLGFYRKTPTIVNIFFTHGPLKFVTLNINFLRNLLYEHTNFNRLQEIDQPPGTLFLTRRSILKTIGGMDEQYPLYFEDVDLALRIKKAGWKQYFLPDATITHYGSASCKKIAWGKRSLLYLESLHKFFLKHYGKLHATIIRGYIIIRLFAILAVIILLETFNKLKIIPPFKKTTSKETLEALQKWLNIKTR